MIVDSYFSTDESSWQRKMQSIAVLLKKDTPKISIGKYYNKIKIANQKVHLQQIRQNATNQTLIKHAF